MINEERLITGNESSQDEKPALDEGWFEEADAYVGTKLVRRGRPPVDKTKVAVSLRLDPEVVTWFKQGGPGWQTRINDYLRKVAGL